MRECRDIPERAWQISVIVILLIAAVLRLYDLNLVPLHHDEGVNGNFLVRLVRDGAYQYDPENYHGPTLYYFAALIPWITRLLFGEAARDNYGMTTFTIRLIPAIFGLATIGLVFLFTPPAGNDRDVDCGADVGGFARRGLSLALLHSRDAVCLLHARASSSRASVFTRRGIRLT